jgi:hypothetical protein
MSLIANNEQARQARDLIFQIIDKALEYNKIYSLSKPPELSFLTFKAQLFEVCASHPRRREFILQGGSPSLNPDKQAVLIKPKRSVIHSESLVDNLAVYQNYLSLLTPEEDEILAQHIGLGPADFFSLIAEPSIPEDRACLIIFLYLFHKQPWGKTLLKPY